MNYLKYLFIITFFVMTFVSECLQGQSAMTDSKDWRDNWFVNVNAGMSNFYGDMTDAQLFSSFTEDVTVGAGFWGGKMITPAIGIRGQFYAGQLKGTRDDLGPFGEYFLALQVMSGNVSLIVNLNNMFFKYSPKRIFTIYGTIGVGNVWYKSRRYDLKTNKIIAQTGFNGKLYHVGEACGGMGLNIRLNYFFDLNLENSWHVVNADNLDTKIGGVKYDTYMYTSLGVTYKFALRSSKSMEKMQDDEIVDVYAKYHEEVSYDDVEVPDAGEDESQITPESSPTEVYIPSVIYKVQVDASYGKPLPVSVLEKYYIPAELKEEYSNGWYRYTAGQFHSFIDATEFKKRMIKQYNAPNAIVLAYHGGELVENFNEETGEVIVDDEMIQNIQEQFEIIEDKNAIDISSRVYRVQIDASFGRPMSMSRINKYDIDASIHEEYSDGWYRYTVGYFLSLSEAQNFRKYLIARFKAYNSLILAYKNGLRIYDFTEDDNTGQENEVVVDVVDPDRNALGNNVDMAGKTIEPIPVTNTVLYSIQIMVSRNKINEISEIFDEKSINLPVYEYLSNGWYKYTVGGFNSLNEARENLILILEYKKMKDAFIVGFENGKRLSTTKMQEER